MPYVYELQVLMIAISDIGLTHSKASIASFINNLFCFCAKLIVGLQKLAVVKGQFMLTLA